jgi:hypothetical protein
MRRDVRILLVGDGQHAIIIQYTYSFSMFRGCWQKHDSDVFDQRILRGSSTSPFPKVMTPQLTASHSQVQHVVPEVTIPPEVTPENVTTYIVDSGGAFIQLRVTTLPS